MDAAVTPRAKTLLENIEKLEKEKELPTPQVATTVWYFPAGKIEDGKEVTAFVTSQDDAGRVSLSIHPCNQPAYHKRSVPYAGAEYVQGKSHTAAVKNTGVWCYPKGKSIRKIDMEFHQEKIGRKLDSLNEEYRSEVANYRHAQELLASQDEPEDQQQAEADQTS